MEKKNIKKGDYFTFESTDNILYKVLNVDYECGSVLYLDPRFNGQIWVEFEYIDKIYTAKVKEQLKMKKVDWEKALICLLTNRNKLTDKELGDYISILEQKIHDLVYENRHLFVENAKLMKKETALKIIIDNEINIRTLKEVNCVGEYIASGEKFLYPEEFEIVKLTI